MAQGGDISKAKPAEQRVAEVYATAYVNAAEKAGEVDGAAADFLALVDELLPTLPNVETYLSSAVVPVLSRSEVIDKAFTGRATTTFVNFLQVLNLHGRLNLLRAIRMELRDLMDQRASKRRVYVESAAPLTDAARSSLLETLKRRMQFEPVLVESVNPELLAGFVVRVMDYRFDGSVRSHLDALRRELIERSSHEIQSRRDRFCTANGN
jgi:F-type H+-transporting ATPase subunit delta